MQLLHGGNGESPEETGLIEVVKGTERGTGWIDQGLEVLKKRSGLFQWAGESVGPRGNKCLVENVDIIN